MSILSLTERHSLPPPPHNALQGSAGFWTCCGDSSDSNPARCCVFLPPVCAGGRAGVLSFVGTLTVLSHTPQTHSRPRWSCGRELQLVHLVGSVSIAFLSHTAPGFVSTPRVGCPQDFAPEPALEALGLPPGNAGCGGDTAAWIAGTLAGLRVQGCWPPQLQELWFWASLFLAPAAGIRRPSGRPCSVAWCIQALRGRPLAEALLYFSPHRGRKGPPALGGPFSAGQLPVQRGCSGGSAPWMRFSSITLPLWPPSFPPKADRLPLVPWGRHSGPRPRTALQLSRIPGDLRPCPEDVGRWQGYPCGPHSFQPAVDRLLCPPTASNASPLSGSTTPCGGLTPASVPPCRCRPSPARSPLLPRLPPPYRVLCGSTYSFPVVGDRSPLSGGVLRDLLPLRMHSRSVRGEMRSLSRGSSAA